MKIKFQFLLLVILVGFLSACNSSEKEVTSLIEKTKQTYAPDKRVAIFDINWKEGKLVGETNLPDALQHLKKDFKDNKINFTDSVNILPDSLLEQTHGIITISVANLRSEPHHSAELVTQATMGTAVNVLKQHRGWYLIQTPDHYIAWVDNSGVELKDGKEMDAWREAEKLIYTGLIGYVYTDSTQEGMVSDLTAGCILQTDHDGDNYSAVMLPDGRSGYVKNSEVMGFKDWLAQSTTAPANLIATAKKMMGVPYLWGGTSVKGVDCSGFTKTVYFLNGLVIPRDASQQVWEGSIVDKDENWSNLRVGDLLFFGRPATGDKSERVVHVGMWIGDSTFIHSSGRVRISSVDPKSDHYDEYNISRYLRTARVIGNPSENVIPAARIVN